MSAICTGHLRKDADSGLVVGEIADEWGWVISLIATRKEDGSYAQRIGDRRNLRIPAIDGEKAK